MSYGSLTKEELAHLGQINIVSIRFAKFRLGLIGTAHANQWADPLQKKIPDATIYHELNLPELYCSYMAIIRKPWNMESSNHLLNNHLWLIKYQESVS